MYKYISQVKDAAAAPGPAGSQKKASKRILSFLFVFSLLLSASLLPETAAEASVIPSSRQSDLIWFGDSRTVQFARAVYGYQGKKKSPNTIYKKHVVAKSSTTLYWAKGTGYKQLRKRLKKNPKAVVIFNFGVNDIGRNQNHFSGYLKLIKKIHRNFPKVKLCFMTVNPVKASYRNPYARSKSRAATVNRRIKSFNSYIKKHLPKGCTYINTNRNVRFTYKDGLHYNKASYRRISLYVAGSRKLKK